MKKNLMVPIICGIAALALGIGGFYFVTREKTGNAAHSAAGSIANMNLEGMVDYSDLIISGTVTNVTGWEVVNNNVFKSSFVTVEITESLKGDKYTGDTAEIEISSFEGIKDVSVASMPANPKFAVGDEVTLFLVPSDHGSYYIVAINQGVFYIDEAAKSNDIIYKHKQRVGNDVESFTRSELLAELARE